MTSYGLEHAAERIVLCDFMACENVADYIDVDEDGHEHFECAAHTNSTVHASRLPKRAPGAGYPYRSKAAA